MRRLAARRDQQQTTFLVPDLPVNHTPNPSNPAMVTLRSTKRARLESSETWSATKRVIREELERLIRQDWSDDADLEAMSTGQRLLGCLEDGDRLASVAWREAARLYAMLRADSRFDQLTYWDSVPESLEVAYCCAALSLLAGAADAKRMRRALDTSAIIAKRPTLRSVVAPEIHWFERETLRVDTLAGPVALGDLAAGWPARKWTSLAAFADYAEHFVPVECTGAAQALIPLANVIKAPDSCYLAQHRLFDQLPSLRASFGLVALTQNDTPVVCAWIGAHCSTPLHADPRHNVVVQILGKKRWRLWRPHASTTSSPDHVFDLGPGSSLFVPRLWLHTVDALGSEPTFAVSYWSSLEAHGYH